MKVKHDLCRLSMVGVLLCASLQPWVAYAHAEHGKPQFGGVFAEAGEAQLEIVSKGNDITVYVTHHGESVATTGLNGRLTVLAGSQKSEILLKPGKGNQMVGSGAVAAGAKVLVFIDRPGKSPLQARAVMP